MSFRFIPPTDDLPGVLQEGGIVATAEYMTPRQAKCRAEFWRRAQELRLLEKLRAEARRPEMHRDERGA